LDINDLELAELLPWIIAAAVVIVLVLVVIALMKRRKRKERSDRLRERFGPEYDRTVERASSRSEAEDQLEARAERRERMKLRSLDPGQRRSFVDRWEDLQASFVDGPASAVRGADVLLDDVALARGYPDASADQRLDDLAMDHSDEVHEYRQANHGEGRDEDGDRRALLAARGLFEALVGPEHEARSERGPDAPFDSSRTMSGREPHDEDTRTLDTRDDDRRDEAGHDADRRDVDRGADVGSRSDDRVEPVRTEPEPSQRAEPLPGDEREANQRAVDGDDASLRDLPPRTEERTIPPPPEPR
jgi:hypothetical protein